jgi:hypothetical protein
LARGIPNLLNFEINTAPSRPARIGDNQRELRDPKELPWGHLKDSL